MPKSAGLGAATAQAPLLHPAGPGPNHATTADRKELGRRQGTIPRLRRVISDPRAQAHPEARAHNRYYVPGGVASRVGSVASKPAGRSTSPARPQAAEELAKHTKKLCMKKRKTHDSRVLWKKPKKAKLLV